jgi:hypothetical protein
VEYNGALHGFVVEPFFQTFHAQGISIGAHVGFLGAEQAKAGLQAAIGIGKVAGNVFTGIFAVGDQFVEQQLAAHQIKYPQAFLGGDQLIVDHGQVARRFHAVFKGAIERGECHVDHLRIGSRRRAGEAIQQVQEGLILAEGRVRKRVVSCVLGECKGAILSGEGAGTAQKC